MRQVLLDEPPDARDVLEVAGLAVAPPQPREDADDLAVALRPEHRVGGHEGGAVEPWEGGEVALLHGGDDGGRHIAPRILEERDEVVAGGADDGVLEIEEAAGG